MIVYRLILSYKGTNYFGWQKQSSEISIQETLEKAAQRIFKVDRILTKASGRTDAGVHALGQVVRMETPFSIESLSLVEALNSQLPIDIRVLSAKEERPEFCPLADCKQKEYHYLFSNLNPSAHVHDLMTFVKGELDFRLMQKACDAFIGEHDFYDFHCFGTPTAHHRREIFNCSLSWVETPSDQFPDHWRFQVVGQGFLKQMVRLMMGSVWNIGKRKISLSQLESALQLPTGKKLAPVAPPQGLYLINASY